MPAPGTQTNIAQIFLDLVQKRKDQPLAWEKRRNIYQSLSWKEIASQANLLTRFFSTVKMQKYERIINFMGNNPHLLALDMAATAMDITSVNLPVDFSTEEHLATLIESEARVVFTDSDKLAEKILGAEGGEAKSVEYIVVPDGSRLTGKARIKVLTWTAAMDMGKTEMDKFVQYARAVQPKDAVALLYTHGADGSLVAIKRSHTDILKLCESIKKSNEAVALSSSDRFLVTAPHGHRAGYHAGHLLPIIVDAQIVYANPQNMEDMSFQSVAPTILVGTSDYFKKLKDFTISQIKQSSGVDSFALEQALKLGKVKYETPTGLTLPQKMLEASLKPVVINRVRNQFGGKLRAIICVDNSMDYDTQLFFYSFGIEFIEGHDEL